MNRLISRLKELDFLMLLSVAVLLGFSLITIYSLFLGSSQEELSNFKKQLIFVFLGAMVFLFFFRTNYQVWLSYSGWLYFLGIILMTAVLFWGVTIRNTSGWFVIGPFSLQPAEPMKLFLIIALAGFFSRRVGSAVSWRDIILSFVYVSIPAFLASKQPDMGSVLVMLAIWSVIVWVAGLKISQFLILMFAGILVAVLSWNFVLLDYHKGRVQSFLNPETDPHGSGYNVIQSTVAVGAGGLFGKGLGSGSQSQLNFLPEKHNDFIFASIAEESGFLGTSLIFVMLGLLFWRVRKTVELAKDKFGRLLAAGVLAFLFSQALVNIGMNIGVMPVAGISLPLISYGGSFLLITLASLGLVQSVLRIAKQTK